MYYVGRPKDTERGKLSQVSFDKINISTDIIGMANGETDVKYESS